MGEPTFLQASLHKLQADYFFKKQNSSNSLDKETSLIPKKARTGNKYCLILKKRGKEKYRDA